MHDGSPSNPGREWKRALVAAVPISVGVLGLITYWFAAADRYAVFLYGHLGATPFDQITSSRYWMAGLVANGVVLMLYTLSTWLLGRLAVRRQKLFQAPAWWRVWLFCAAPLAVGIPAVTMNLNEPVLPWPLALACTVATLAGLALALSPGRLAARQPRDLVWIALHGLGLAPVLLLFHFVELPSRGFSPAYLAYAAGAASVILSVIWLGIMVALSVWRRKPEPSAVSVLVAGLCISYLLAPLAHHLLLTPQGYRYITASSNIFARSFGLQALIVLLASLLAVGATRARRMLGKREPQKEAAAHRKPG